MDETVEQIVGRIAEAIHPEKVFSFGSRAGGAPDSGSDIDLLVLYRGAQSPRLSAPACAVREAVMPLNPAQFSRQVCDECLAYLLAAFPLSDPDLSGIDCRA